MKRRPWYLVTLLATAFTLAACGDNTSSNDPDASVDDADGSVSDVGDGSDSTPDDGSDGGDGIGDSSDAEIIQPGSRAVGESCISGVQCASQLCVTFETGVEGFCSQICDQTVDCPSASSGGTFQCLQLPQNSNDDLKGCIDTSFCYDPDEDGYGVGPGCDRIGFDCDQTDATINAGATETCDNVDRNCNGLVIDSVVFDEPTCTIAGQIGACALGERRCEPAFASDGETVTGGDVVCEQVVFPGELDEVCNGIDDDCDGIRDDFVDDDGNYEVAGLGVSCATSVDACPNGRTTCDVSSGEITCVATGDNPTGGDESLVCDGIDNNCNGETDEPFKNDDGIYFMADNCGSCDVNCDNFWDGRPEDFNVVPFCDVNETFAVCNFDCAAGFVNADGLDDNGCELNPDEEAIYVTRPARGGVDNEACGPYTAPCATIAYAMNKAQADGTKSRVRVAEGSYAESIELMNGVSVLGGHNATNFVRNVDANVTTLTGATVAGNRIHVVRANEITETTEFSGFSVRAPAARDGRSSIGMLIINSTNALTVSDNRIVAGAGGSGVRGVAGANGEDGSNGSAGANSRNNQSSCGDPVQPGAGGAKLCPDLRGSGTERVDGGRGAPGNGCPEFGKAQPAASPGMGTVPPGAGGLSAHYWDAYNLSNNPRRCLQPDDPGEITDGSTLQRFAVRGGRGSAGTDGNAGAGAANATGSFDGSTWVGQSGAVGQAGLFGSGGGGGGAGGGLDVRSSSTVYIGSSGGGGGSGGCAGSGGTGGSSGGASFAVVIVQTGAPGDAPILTGNTLIRGNGGSGGAGGNAGSGGDGGLGGGPGFGQSGGNYGFCMANGESGGVGGRGGHGGGGGGGAGGASFDVLIISSNADATNSASGATSNNEFPIGAGENTGGDGGAGGSSQTNVGIDGVDGASGRLLKLQP